MRALSFPARAEFRKVTVTLPLRYDSPTFGAYAPLMIANERLGMGFAVAKTRRVHGIDTESGTLTRDYFSHSFRCSRPEFRPDAHFPSGRGWGTERRYRIHLTVPDSEQWHRISCNLPGIPVRPQS